MTASLALDDGLSALGLDIPLPAQRRLLDYVKLLLKWNRTYNLTAIRDEPDMLTHHVLDALAVLPLLRASLSGLRRLVDVGSGAGLPGIPLAIACPDLAITLVDAVSKKSAFQRQAKIELGLENVTIVAARVEDVPAGACDGVVSRAFADLADFVKLSGHLPVQGGRLYAMKGQLNPEELQALPLAWRIAECQPLRVPGLEAQRHLIVLEKV